MNLRRYRMEWYSPTGETRFTEQQAMDATDALVIFRHNRNANVGIGDPVAVFRIIPLPENACQHCAGRGRNENRSDCSTCGGSGEAAKESP